MAESEAKLRTEEVQVETKQLKYLNFVRLAAIYVVVCLSTVYDYAKDIFRRLKSGVQTFKGTVRAVIGWVYDKFHGVPMELLNFVDRKVDVLITEVFCHVPSLIKQALSQALAVASEVRRNGLVDPAGNILKTVCTKYEPLAEQCAVLAWRSLNRLPLVPQVTHILVPTATYWSEKYNQAVAYLAGKGYTVSYYMPLIPVERIAKVFAGAEDGPTGSTNVKAEVEIHSD